MPELPTIESTTTVAKSRLFQIEAVNLRFSNGEQRCFERIPSFVPAAVLIVPCTHDGQVLLIEEYSVGTERYEWVFPKGAVDQGETIMAAANRELQEEVGYAAQRLDHVDCVSIAPGYFGHRTHIVMARGLVANRLAGDEPEPMAVIHWPLDDIAGLVAQPQFSEARSIAALYMVQHKLL